MPLEEVTKESWTVLGVIGAALVGTIKMLYSSSEKKNAERIEEHKEQISTLGAKVDVLTTKVEECETDRTNLRLEMAVLNERIGRSE